MESGRRNFKRYFICSLIVMIGLLVFAPGTLAAVRKTAGAGGELTTGKAVTDWLAQQRDNDITIEFVGNLVLDEERGSAQNTNGIVINQSPKTEVTFASDPKNVRSIIRGQHLRAESAILIRSGSLVLQDITIDGGSTETGRSFGVDVNSAGTLTMKQGTTIKKHHASSAGSGVANRGTFIMEGGLITENESPNGAGVTNLGTFTMEGGTISQNRAFSTTNVNASGRGGGVFNQAKATFVLNGGSIIGNTAEVGGGVYNYGNTLKEAERGNFTMEKGEISGNRAVYADGKAGRGGGVYNHGAVFTMKGGTISKNQAVANPPGSGVHPPDPPSSKQPITTQPQDGYGGGVYNFGTVGNNTNKICEIKAAAFILQGGSISENEAELGGGGFYNQAGLVDYYHGQESDIPKGATVEMKGGEVTQNTAKNGGGIHNADGLVAITAGMISENTASENGGGIYSLRNTNSTHRDFFIVEQATIANNKAGISGGGIYNGYQFVIAGATVRGNEAPAGGGVTNIQAFTFWSGEITGNKAIGNGSDGVGGGVYNDGSYHNPVFTMKGGKITQNEATDGSGQPNGRGGGIANEAKDTRTTTTKIEAGEISANTAGRIGGGIFNDGAPVPAGVTKSSSGTVSLGVCDIIGNKAPVGGGIHVGKGMLNIAGATITKNEADFGAGINSENMQGVMTSGSVTENTAVSHGGGLAYNLGDFVISGGTIANNTLTGAGALGWDLYIKMEADTMPDLRVKGGEGTIQLGTSIGRGIYVTPGSPFRPFKIEKKLVKGTSFYLEESEIYQPNFVFAEGVKYTGTEANYEEPDDATEANAGYFSLAQNSENYYYLAPNKNGSTRKEKAQYRVTQAPVVRVTQNGTPWDLDGGELSLCQNGKAVAQTTAYQNGDFVFTGLAVGKYQIHDAKGDTGVVLDLTGDNPVYNQTLRYFTIDFSAATSGFATGAEITSTTYGDADIKSGALVLAGKELKLTAAGEGADDYIYTWNVNEVSAGNSTSELTLPSLTQKTTVVCTVTGRKAAKVAIHKDGTLWQNNNKAVTLVKESKTIKPQDPTANSLTFMVADNDSYEVYADGVGTGKSVAAGGNTTVDYFTAGFPVTDGGQAAGSYLTAAYGGKPINLDTPFLPGQKLVLTAHGMGANSYTYNWTEGGSSVGTQQTYTIDPFTTKPALSCTVTGTKDPAKAMVSVYQDGTSWDDYASDITLRNGEDTLEADEPKGNPFTFSITDDTIIYDVYVSDSAVGDTNTGLKVSGGGSVEVNYYTADFPVIDLGDAQGSYLEASYDDEPLALDKPFLAGKALALTAHGQGADYYTYAWYLGETKVSEEQSYTIDPFTARPDLSCRVTGTIIPLVPTSVEIYKDGNPSNEVNKAFTLVNDRETIQPDNPPDSTLIFNAKDGESYEVYADGEPTGKSVLGGESIALNYVTITFDVEDKGKAKDSKIAATYDKAGIDSGAVVLSGKTLVLTATGTDPCEYTWQEGDKDLEWDEAVLVVDNVNSKRDYLCIVKGLYSHTTIDDFDIVKAFGQGSSCTIDGAASEVERVVINGVDQVLEGQGTDHIDMTGPNGEASGQVAVGSATVTLYADYLDSFANGVYEVKVYFKEGLTETTLTIDRPAPNPSPTGPPTPTGTPAPGSDSSTKANPRTGDAGDLGTWCLLMALSVVGVVGLRRRLSKN